MSSDVEIPTSPLLSTQYNTFEREVMIEGTEPLSRERSERKDGGDGGGRDDFHQGLQNTQRETCGSLVTRYILIFFSGLLSIIPLMWPFCIAVFKEYERAVIFRLGKLHGGAKGPGIFFFLPCVDQFVRVDLRTITLDVMSQEMITKDSVTVRVNAVIYMNVYDCIKAVNQVENYKVATSLFSQTTLRSVVGESELDELLSKRDKINHKLQDVIDRQTDEWGIRVTAVEVKDVHLPPNMQRAMASQAEAERERRAKIISAEGEVQAANQLQKAAETMAKAQGSMQLRYLQTINNIATEKNSTIIFPLPIDMLAGIKDEPGRAIGFAPGAEDD